MSSGLAPAVMGTFLGAWPKRRLRPRARSTSSGTCTASRFFVLSCAIRSLSSSRLTRVERWVAALSWRSTSFSLACAASSFSCTSRFSASLALRSSRRESARSIMVDLRLGRFSPPSASVSSPCSRVSRFCFSSLSAVSWPLTSLRKSTSSSFSSVSSSISSSYSRNLRACVSFVLRSSLATSSAVFSSPSFSSVSWSTFTAIDSSWACTASSSALVASSCTLDPNPSRVVADSSSTPAEALCCFITLSSSLSSDIKPIITSSSLAFSASRFFASSRSAAACTAAALALVASASLALATSDSRMISFLASDSSIPERADSTPAAPDAPRSPVTGAAAVLLPSLSSVFSSRSS
mmetsp:Transcript_26915/g.70719  ORF Transcript_26915/g.70719 Transcript_26915/m.70719 type:complete len:352 (+) Transcript_26915:157-1212(+)